MQVITFERALSALKIFLSRALAEKLGADAAARTDVKLALVDVLDEALQGLLGHKRFGGF